jgi:hypothetical protein
VEVFVGTIEGAVLGMGLQSSTSQLNLSSF